MRARLVIPGRAPDTSFSASARTRVGTNISAPYADLAAEVFARFQQSTEEVTRTPDVAEAMWRAATDPSCPMRLPAGTDAITWAEEA